MGGKGKGKGKSFAPVVVVEQTLQTFASVSVPSEGAQMAVTRILCH